MNKFTIDAKFEIKGADSPAGAYAFFKHAGFGMLVFLSCLGVAAIILASG